MNMLPALSVICLLGSLVAAALWRDRSRPLYGELAIGLLVAGWLLLAAEAVQGLSPAEMDRALNGLAVAGALLVAGILIVMAIGYGVVLVNNARAARGRRST